MKKAISLIELVFSIVVIAICLSVIPKVVEISSKNTTLSFRQEYIYELKSLYGVIRNLPFEDKNYCKDDFSSNSLLSQYCILDSTDLYENTHAKAMGINLRFVGSRTPGGAPSYIQNIKNTNNLAAGLNFKDVLGNEIEYKFGENNNLNVNNDKTIKLSGDCDIKNRSCLLDLKIFSNEKPQLAFKVPFHRLGRLDSIYSRYQICYDCQKEISTGASN